jgi:hypothetical protein
MLVTLNFGENLYKEGLWFVLGAHLWGRHYKVQGPNVNVDKRLIGKPHESLSPCKKMHMSIGKGVGFLHKMVWARTMATNCSSSKKTK